jgi:hypothetical protein
MQIKIFLIGSILFYVACNSINKTDIIGTWSSVYALDLTGMDLSDEIEFNNDGSYKATIYSNGDSIVEQIKGTFLVDNVDQTLQFFSNGTIAIHQIIEFEKTYIIFQTPQGAKMTMKRKK